MYYDKVWEQGDLSGGFLVAKGDKILFEKYRGFAKENEQVSIDKNTPLHVASVSKNFNGNGNSEIGGSRQIKITPKK